MSMYPWRAGEAITAEKLTAGMQRGLVAVALTEQIEPPGPGNNYAHFAAAIYLGSAAVVFDVPFTEIPTIQLTPRTGFPGVFIEAAYTDVTPTGFTISVARRSAATTNIDWTAIGRPAL